MSSSVLFKKGKRLAALLSLNSIVTTSLIDTGADISSISLATFEKLRKRFPSLQLEPTVIDVVWR
jgi:hypothetical protein